MRNAVLVMPFLALVAACGSSQAGGNNSGDAEALPPPSYQEQVDTNLTIDPQNSMVPVASPSPSAVAGLPAGFAGRWGMTVNDCDPTRADDKGVMTIAGDRLTFYESRATATDVKTASPGRVTAALSFTGEGQTWRRATALTLLDDGRTLVREEQDPVTSYRYSRCP